MKRIISLLLIFIPLCLNSADLLFLDSSFDGFMERMVSNEDQKQFEKYYYKVKEKYDKHKKNDAKWKRKCKKEIRELQQLGQSSLQVRKPIWAEQVRLARQKSDKAQEKRIRTFLFRVGVYEDFLQKEGAKQHTLWAKTKSYVRNAGNSVVSWFQSWKKPKTVAV